jgi:starch synthase
MKILFATSEIAPLIKTGGLADVSAALPAALHQMGVDIRVLVPGYPQILKSMPSLQHIVHFDRRPECPGANLFMGTMQNGVSLMVLVCPELYQRGGSPYQDEHGIDWIDNAQRFGLLSKITALLGSAASPLEWKPDVVHCNDWQTALAPAYMHYAQGAAPCVMTVHNLAFQGVFPPETTVKLGLPAESFQQEGVEFFGSLSFLKAGLYYADRITTVSPSYAKEIQAEELGFGLQGLLASRQGILTGIVNGIDTDEWNPAADPNLAQPYDAADLRGKAINKLELQRKMGLQVDPDVPLFGLVSRFTHQKGLDIVLEAATQLLAMPAQLVFLGSGDAEMQRTVLELSHQHSGRVGAYVGFDEGLSHLIEAGVDIFLMPSRFEPCGLNQMYSQRYGTPPIVHATGGLIDTVVDTNAVSLARGDASGFVFDSMNVQGLLDTAQRAVTAYHDKKTWHKIQLNGMKRDFGWSQSAAAYHSIYLSLMQK